jgi:HSP20 family molecular chaperone IbpA
MNRSHLSNPLLLGFDQVERLLDRVAKAGGDGYPPYNIERLADDTLRVTLAVAGFTRDELDVTIEDNQLIISGEQRDDSMRTYLYRGIAARRFRRSFGLTGGINVIGASLDNGLLHIDLVRPQPEKAVRRIDIAASTPPARQNAQDMPLTRKNRRAES